MPKFIITKKVRRQLRELIHKSYAQELNNHLNGMALSFDEWRNGKITCWDLNDIIHKFHDHTSRDLFKLYNYSQNELLLVARAVANKIIQLNEVPNEVHEVVSKLVIQFFENDDTQAFS